MKIDEIRELQASCRHLQDGLSQWRAYPETFSIGFRIEEEQWTWREYTIATITLIAIIILI